MNLTDARDHCSQVVSVGKFFDNLVEMYFLLEVVRLEKLDVH